MRILTTAAPEKVAGGAPAGDKGDDICSICGEWLHVFKDTLVHGSAAMLERCQILEKRHTK